MRIGSIGAAWAICLLLAGPSWAQSAASPGTTSPNPGAAATDAILSPSKPPADIAPGGAGSARPTRPPTEPRAAAGGAQTVTPPPGDDMAEILAAAREIAKASRENVDYSRVMPDILTQMLVKLDKLENKLDKIENILREPPPARGRR